MRGATYFHMMQHVAIIYFAMAGLAFLLFYVLFRNQKKFRKIQPGFPKLHDYWREIGYSTVAMAIFTTVPLVILHSPAIAPHTTYYTHIDDHGWLYFYLAFPIRFLVHDCYFYWAHRLMHSRILFRRVHLVHHRSTNPTPWAAYSIHPLESIIEAGIFPVFLFTIPIHTLHITIFFLIMIIYNVYGHLGYELYPKGFNRHWLGKWINTSVSHNQHHQFFSGNYGLYFTIWDRMMGTLRPDYDQRFEGATEGIEPDQSMRGQSGI